MTTHFFSLLSFIAVLDPRSEIRDPGWVKIRIWDQHSTLRWRTTCLELGVGGEEAPPVAGAAGQHHQLTRQQAGVECLGHKHLLRQKSVQQTSKNEYSGSTQSNQMLGRSRVLL
jgi:hypothetical protein